MDKKKVILLILIFIFIFIIIFLKNSISSNKIKFENKVVNNILSDEQITSFKSKITLKLVINEDLNEYLIVDKNSGIILYYFYSKDDAEKKMNELKNNSNYIVEN